MLLFLKLTLFMLFIELVQNNVRGNSAIPPKLGPTRRDAVFQLNHLYQNNNPYYSRHWAELFAQYRSLPPYQTPPVPSQPGNVRNLPNIKSNPVIVPPKRLSQPYSLPLATNIPKRKANITDSPIIRKPNVADSRKRSTSTSFKSTIRENLRLRDIEENSLSDVDKNWLYDCWIIGYNRSRGGPFSICVRSSHPSDPKRSGQLNDQCSKLYMDGCRYGMDLEFCDSGMRNVTQAQANGMIFIDEGFDCTSLAIEEDIKSYAFQCCVSCKQGIAASRFASTMSCVKDLDGDISSRALERCCKISKSLQAQAAKPPIVVDSLSMLLSLNDDKINQSLYTKFGDPSAKANSSTTTLKPTESTPTVIEPTSPSTASPITSEASSPSEEPSTSSDSESSTSIPTTTPQTEKVTKKNLFGYLPFISGETTTTTQITTVTTPSTTTTTPSTTTTTEPSTTITTQITTVTTPSTTTTTTTEPTTTRTPTEPTTKTTSFGFDSLSTAEVREIKCNPGQILSADREECVPLQTCEYNSCGDGDCYDIPGDIKSFKCCEKGSIYVNNGCYYLNYCSPFPCDNYEDDIHHCVNYFTGHECVDIIDEGYKLMDKRENLTRLIDKSDSSKAAFLDIVSREVALVDNYENFKLYNVSLPESLNCNWKFKVLKVLCASTKNKISRKNFITDGKRNEFHIIFKGEIAPQAVGVSIVCEIKDKPIYENRVYFSFKPKKMIDVGEAISVKRPKPYVPKENYDYDD